MGEEQKKEDEDETGRFASESELCLRDGRWGLVEARILLLLLIWGGRGLLELQIAWCVRA